MPFLKTLISPSFLPFIASIWMNCYSSGVWSVASWFPTRSCPTFSMIPMRFACWTFLRRLARLSCPRLSWKFSRNRQNLRRRYLRFNQMLGSTLSKEAANLELKLIPAIAWALYPRLQKHTFPILVLLLKIRRLNDRIRFRWARVMHSKVWVFHHLSKWSSFLSLRCQRFLG